MNFERRNVHCGRPAICENGIGHKTRIMFLLVLMGLISFFSFTESFAAFVQHRRVIEAGEMGISNPAGLAFSSRANAFHVVARWRQDLTTPADTDIVKLNPLGLPVDSDRIMVLIRDPINMAFDNRANRLLILLSPTNSLIDVLEGPDGNLDLRTLIFHDAMHFGLVNPQGMTVDPLSGHLFILDTIGPRILRIEPESDGGFANASISEVDLRSAGLGDVRGLAFDPTTDHLHLLSHSEQELYELTQNGQVVAVRDLSEFGLSDPQSIVFAPSGDLTDDPSEVSLYIADSGLMSTSGEIVISSTGTNEVNNAMSASGQIVELSFTEAAAPAASTFQSSLIQTINAWQWSPPSPDSAGIVYLPNTDSLLVADSEVNEMPIFTGDNLFEATLTGDLIRTLTTISFSDEPTGVTFNPSNEHLFFSDDTGTRSIYELNPGPDGLYDTSDDIITSFGTGSFGSSDPEGVAFANDQGVDVLFIADGVNREVYRVDPGVNGIFDGADDQVTSFDTLGLGLDDPEGIAFNPDSGNLYVVGKPSDTLFEITTSGTLIQTIDISAANADKPAGLAYAPGSVNPNVMNIYIAARGVDNNSDPNENDGKVYELSLPISTGNAFPVVTITMPANGSTFNEGDTITFTGTASDAEDGDLTASLAWSSSLDGTIGSGGSFSTSTLSVGAHTITASVTDSGGQPGSDAITVAVQPEGVTILEVRVASGSDDAEESETGSVNLTSSDLELVLAGSNQTVGMRFNGISIPQGATIANAYIQFQVDETSSTPTSLTIQGEGIDDAPTFTSSSGNISSRARTTSSAGWTPPPWLTVGEAGVDQQTPDISSVIQEIVNRQGWTSGNSLVIIVTGTGERIAESYDGVSSAAPLLHVEYGAFAGETDCNDGIDNDNNGFTDCEDPSCEGLTKGECATGQPGICSTGTFTCQSGEEVCVPDNSPQIEVCDNLDNDCDGGIDENLTRPTTCGVGECSGNAGEETCTAGTWGNDTCDPLAGALPETCDGTLDEDCDGTVDEGCACTDEDTRPCGSDIGECVAGTETCTGGEWSGICVGEIGPTAEVCDNLDNDCDGGIDENLTRPTTCGVGECFGNVGEETCTAGAWGNDTCDPFAGSSAEVCDNLDNDCDGPVDEDLTQSTTCGVGECAATGIETCSAGTWGGDTCTPGAPTEEICDGLDNNCDGNIDELFDADNDSYTTCNNDCNDDDPAINPSACDIKYDGIDQDCDGVDRIRGKACPGVGRDPEICDDGIDNDRDGKTDCADRKDCGKDPAC